MNKIPNKHSKLELLLLLISAFKGQCTREPCLAFTLNSCQASQEEAKCHKPSFLKFKIFINDVGAQML
jgi:hypothetical protein